MSKEIGLVNKESGTLNDLLKGNNALINEATDVVKTSDVPAIKTERKEIEDALA